MRRVQHSASASRARKKAWIIAIAILTAFVLHAPAPAEGKRKAARKLQNELELPEVDGQATTDEPLNADDLDEGSYKVAPEQEEEWEPEVEDTGPVYVIDAPLKGFDLSILKSSRWGHKWRYKIVGLRGTPMTADSSDRSTRFVQFDLSIEFGKESGMAEAKSRELSLKYLIEDITGDFKIGGEPRLDLRTIAGKLALKRKIIRNVNRMFKTAKVRRVYFTEFFIVRMS